MAQVPRTVPLAGVANTNATSSRTPVVARGTAIGSSQPVGDLAGSFGLAFDDHQFQFRDYRGGHGGGAEQDQQSQQSQQGTGPFQAPSEFFVTLHAQIPSASGINVAETTGTYRNVGFEGLLSHAISSYETNARVIHEPAPTRGTSMSFQL